MCHRPLVPFLALVLTAPIAAVAAPKKGPPPPAGADQETNAIALLAGAREYEADGATVCSAANGLVDGSVDEGGQWEPSKDSGDPVARLRLAEPYDLVRAEVVNAVNEPMYPGISTKELRLEWGATGQGPWKVLAQVKLQKGTKAQPIAIPATPGVRWLRVTMLSNFGNGEWWGLGELRVFGRRSQPRTVRFDGAWDTNYGQMVLKQDGQRITGCYGGSDGGKAGDAIVEGTLEGSVFFGTWTEHSGDQRSDGGIAFALTSEGELSGVWGNDVGGSDRANRWDGTPRKKRTITCEPPEKSLAEDLSDGRAVLRGILFDTGQDAIRTESEAVLQALAAAMRQAGATRYVVEGHTDDRGGAAFNLELSNRRAGAVKAWLVKAGIAADRLDTKGFGQTRPALPNESDAGRAANRRVEVAVVP